MSAQSAMQGLAGTVIGGAATIAMGAKKLGAGDKAGSKDSGIDMQMAAKARKEAQAKINAIYANREISKKAKTRRLGKVMDDYNKQIGGKK